MTQSTEDRPTELHPPRRRRLLLLMAMTCATLALCQSDFGSEITQTALDQYAGPPIHSPDFALRVAHHRTMDGSKVTSGPVRHVAMDGRVRGAVVPVAADHIVARLTGDGGELEALGARVLRRSPYTGKAIVALPDTETPESFARQLVELGLAQEAHPDPICHGAGKGKNKNTTSVAREASVAEVEPPQVPTAPLRALQWHLDALDMDPLWSQKNRATHAGMAVVAVLDTGVAYEDHTDASGTYAQSSDLSGVTFHPGYDFVNDDAHPNDDNQHGTHMANVIAGLGGGLGVAYGVDLMPIKVLDDSNVGTESALVDGIHWAIDHGANVINLSLAFPRGYLPSQDLEEAINAAQTQEITVVSATGNAGQDAVAYPAAFPSVIAVGAVEMKKSGNWIRYDHSAYSNSGPAIDLAAPGGSIVSDVNRDGYPDAILAQTFSPCDPLDEGYWFFSGTSAAAAQVSALSAILYGEGVRGDDIRWALQNRTEPTDGMVSRCDYNHQTGRCLVQGWGAYQSLSEPHMPSRRHAVNTTLLFGIDREGQRKGVAFFEVLELDDDALEEKSFFFVHYELFGDVSGPGVCQSITPGLCVATFDVPSNMGLVGVSVHGIEDNTNFIHRPTNFTRMDLLSYRLVASMASGLRSSAVAMTFSEGALRDFQKAVYTDDVVLTPTVSIRNVGAALSSSSMTLAADLGRFQSSDLSSRYVLFESGGTGLGASSLIWDTSFFNPTFLLEPRQDALIFSYPTGTGLGASSILVGDLYYSLGDFNQTLDPAIAWFSTGVGLGASSIIVDVSLWNPALFTNLQDFGGALSSIPGGTGLGASSLVLDFTPSTVSFLGFDPMLFDFSGVGLGASSFVFNYTANLYSLTAFELTTSMSLGMNMDVVGAASLGESELIP